MKLAFVDMEFHKKTKSGDFLREIFSSEFIVHDFWYDSTRKKAHSLINELEGFDYIFFFQVLFPYQTMVTLRRKNKKIIWAPMYDGLPMSNYYWSKIASLNIKLFCFSGAITSKAEQYCIDHSSFRYFKEPANEDHKLFPAQLTVFFWYRGNISFNDWIACIRDLPVKKILYMSVPDPKFKKEEISDYDIKKYNIEFINNNFIKKEDYLKLVKECDIFICPRKQEGIGMTMVEALAMGKFMIGYNDYTMIDYIVHKKNGFIFDKNREEVVELSDIKSSGEYCREYAKNGYMKWHSEIKKISESFYNISNTSRLVLDLKILFFILFESIKTIFKRIAGNALFAFIC